MQLERVGSVYTESLCGDDVKPAIKNLLEQSGIWVSRPCVPGALEQLECEFADLGFKFLNSRSARGEGEVALVRCR